MIEKPKTVYEVDDDTIRLLDPAHFQEFKSRNSVGTRLKGNLRQYIREFADKVEILH